jgi:hypothetical protein
MFLTILSLLEEAAVVDHLQTLLVAVVLVLVAIVLRGTLKPLEVVGLAKQDYQQALLILQLLLELVVELPIKIMVHLVLIQFLGQ